MRPLSWYIGARVVTQSGRRIGHCHDLHGRITGSRLQITGLSVGSTGWLDHLGIGRNRRATIPWDAVADLRPGTITVRDDYAS
jgi:sporulation protein YlmC with PRC-barrel domain